MRIPPALEDAVYAAIGDALPPTSALLRAIVDRSKRYTSERERLAQRDAADLAARAAFFTIADAMKIAVPIGELARRAALPAARPLRVVDLGAGCGAMSLGLLAALPDVPLELLAIDQDAAALGIAKRAVAAFGGAMTTRTADATSAAIPPADLVVMGTLLNELPVAARLPLIARALAAVSPDGAVIAIEPALRDTSRALHELRDQVLAQGIAHVFAPCIRQGPCPALVEPTDWCHEDRVVHLPPRTAELARLTHLRDDGLKFSYLVLRRDPARLVEPAGAWRIVSTARIAKGKHEVTGCGEPGWAALRLLKRNRTAITKELERAERGDVIVTDAAPGPDRVEILETSRLERIR